MTVRKARSAAYRIARDLGNAQAATRGPGAYARRAARRVVYRKTNGAVSAILRRLGL